ncbi:MAG TPA: hypothetical protein VMB21_19975 [Candidatus Limnocylindria bacterium]|jgi:hypothetical protein|nr:hypothetical protein [Candidatus Limnocylindria bacterium]
MNLSCRRISIFWSLFLLIAPVALAQTNGLVLVGNGQDLINGEAIAAVAQLTKPVRGESTNMWMLDGRAQSGRLYLLDVLFAPKLVSDRALRCRGLRCLGFPRAASEKEVKFDRVGNWYLYDEPSREYCWIVPAGEKISGDKPVGERFEIHGEVSDSDLIALFDATRHSVPNASGLEFLVEDSSHAVVSVHSDGSYLYFEKKMGIWTETHRRNQ